MAEIFDFYVADNRTIKFNPIEPILQEDNGVAVWRFRIPKMLNNIDMSGFAWWFVYINAAKQKYSEPLTLTADADDPDNYCIADYTIDYGISLTPGSFTFALEAINANGSGEIIEEWHTKTYSHSVIGTLQGNQAEYSETESDIISALMVQIQEKYNALVGGATPIPVASISAMTDTSKIYLLTTDNNWYCYNGSTWVSGGLYASGIVIDPTLTQSGQAADAKVVGDALGDLQDTVESFVPGLSYDAKEALLSCFEHVAWVDSHGQDYYDALRDALYADARIVSISATFTQGTAKIYTSDSLDALKQYLVVTATDYGGTESVVSDYVLSGTLTEGTSTITVIYGGKTTTFDVTVTGEQTNLLYNWDFTKSLTDSVSGKTATTNATRDSNGVTIGVLNEYIDFDTNFGRDMTCEIDVDYFQAEENTQYNYRRLFAFGTNGTNTSANNAAMVFGRSSKWRMYTGSLWDDNVDYGDSYSAFNGKTVKIYIASDGILKLSTKTIGAIDDTYVLVGTSTKATNDFTNAKVYIGGSTADVTGPARIKAFRIYEGEK